MLWWRSGYRCLKLLYHSVLWFGCLLESVYQLDALQIVILLIHLMDHCWWWLTYAVFLVRTVSLLHNLLVIHVIDWLYFDTLSARNGRQSSFQWACMSYWCPDQTTEAADKWSGNSGSSLNVFSSWALFGFTYLSLSTDISTYKTVWESIWKQLMTIDVSITCFQLISINSLG